MPVFTRFAETLERKSDSRVARITVKVLVSDCTGRVWFTDLMLQESDKLTGYLVETDVLLEKRRDEGEIVSPVFFNGIVRENATIIYYNSGTESTGLDVYLYPEQSIAKGEISVSHQEGANKTVFMETVKKGDTISLLASTHQCLKNGNTASKRGFFQYSAMGDNKHMITLGEKKRANILVELQEMQSGEKI